MTKKLVALVVVVLVLGAGFHFYYWRSGIQPVVSNSPTPLASSPTISPLISSAFPTPRPSPTPTPVVSGEPIFTMAQVRAHNSAASCYVVISGGVYDLTSYVNQHPGGPDRILNICGTDATAAFAAQHSGQRRPANELAGFKIGRL